MSEVKKIKFNSYRNLNFSFSRHDKLNLNLQILKLRSQWRHDIIGNLDFKCEIISSKLQKELVIMQYRCLLS